MWVVATGREKSSCNSLSLLGFWSCFTGSLTTSIDNTSSTSNNDTYNGSFVDNSATGTTINPGDIINGGSGTDTVQIAASDSVAGGNPATLSAVNFTATPDLDGFAAHMVVDCVEEAFRERMVIAEKLLVNSRVEQQRIDVGKQRIQKVGAQTFLLLLIKLLPVLEIAHCDIQNLDS